VTDQERIADLEQRLAEMELRVLPRLEVVLAAMTAVQGVAVDALALLALQDRDMVEGLLRIRRLSHQATGSGPVSAEMLNRYETALAIADQLATARPLRPQ